MSQARKERIKVLKANHQDCFCHATDYTCNIGILLEVIEEQEDLLIEMIEQEEELL